MQMILPYCHRHRHYFTVCYATIVEPFSHRIANVFVDLRTFPLPSIYIKNSNTYRTLFFNSISSLYNGQFIIAIEINRKSIGTFSTMALPLGFIPLGRCINVCVCLYVRLIASLEL